MAASSSKPLTETCARRQHFREFLKLYHCNMLAQYEFRLRAESYLPEDERTPPPDKWDWRKINQEARIRYRDEFPEYFGMQDDFIDVTICAAGLSLNLSEPKSRCHSRLEVKLNEAQKRVRAEMCPILSRALELPSPSDNDEIAGVVLARKYVSVLNERPGNPPPAHVIRGDDSVGYATDLFDNLTSRIDEDITLVPLSYNETLPSVSKKGKRIKRKADPGKPLFQLFRGSQYSSEVEEGDPLLYKRVTQVFSPANKHLEIDRNTTRSGSLRGKVWKNYGRFTSKRSRRILIRTKEVKEIKQRASKTAHELVSDAFDILLFWVRRHTEIREKRAAHPLAAKPKDAIPFASSSHGS